ncbi:hypothetical protein GCM10010123_37790 [Pilimelia anulata]|uniref:EcsC family protein n=1 Tax=Pilimelia anulata TaxID=53371 RepID=A0A8J3B9L8_9ACTN|nr:hypothetical protein [Pilimelia anulata]GGK04314.1 hypothetical protein GCM10010123_37790 [Pilimelia anulata]
MDLKLIEKALRFAHENVDGASVGQAVDKMGIDGYIRRCAVLAGVSGGATALGGPAFVLLGVPADLANTALQQVKVTMAVIYHRTGRYRVSFDEFVRIAAISLGIEAAYIGVGIVTKEIAKRLTAKLAGRLVPFFGAAVGFGLNVGYITALGRTLLALEERVFRDEPPPPALVPAIP